MNYAQVIEVLVATIAAEASPLTPEQERSVRRHVTSFLLTARQEGVDSAKLSYLACQCNGVNWP